VQPLIAPIGRFDLTPCGGPLTSPAGLVQFRFALRLPLLLTRVAVAPSPGPRRTCVPRAVTRLWFCPVLLLSSAGVVDD